MVASARVCLSEYDQHRCYWSRAVAPGLWPFRVACVSLGALHGILSHVLWVGADLPKEHGRFLYNHRPAGMWRGAGSVLRDKQMINLSINLSDQRRLRRFISINKPAGAWRLFLFE